MRHLLAAVVIVLAATSACKQRRPATSGALHKEGEPTVSASPFQWHTVTDAELVEFSKEVTMGSGRMLPRDHRLTEWSQRWVTRMYDHWAAKMEGVAPPRLIVQAAKEINAASTTIPVCIAASVKIGDAPVSREEETDAALITNIGLSKLKRNGPPCAQSPRSGEGPAFVEFFNSLNYNCTLVWDNGTIIANGPTCAESFTKRQIPFRTAKQLAYLAASNVIVVNLPFLQAMPTPQAYVATLAHEFAHYTRAHGLMRYKGGQRLFDFFYDQSAQPANQRPTPVADDAALQTERAAISNLRKVTAAGQKLDAHIVPWLANSLFSVVMDFCSESGGCPKACKAARDLAAEELVIHDLKTALVEDEAASYLNFETKTFECAKGIKSAKLTQLEASFREAHPWFTGTWPTEAKLDGLLKALSNAGMEQDKRRTRFFDNLRQRNLQLYSFEQEADEISLETLVALGVDPRAAIDLQVALGQVFEKDAIATGSEDILNSRGLRISECLEVKNGGWRATPNDPPLSLYVSQGDFSDPHHGTCFRLFEIERELRDHNYVVAAPSAEVSADLSKETWDEILGLVAQEAAGQ